MRGKSTGRAKQRCKQGSGARRRSARAVIMDDATMKLGLLIESAQAHQKSAEVQLEKLRVPTDDLDGVVRGEIRRTLIEELQMLTAESARAAQVLQRVGRTSVVRGTVWSIF